MTEECPDQSAEQTLQLTMRCDIQTCFVFLPFHTQPRGIFTVRAVATASIVSVGVFFLSVRTVTHEPLHLV